MQKQERIVVINIQPGLVPVAYLQICSSSQQISPWQRKQAPDAWKAWRRIGQFLNSVLVVSCSSHIFGGCLVKRFRWCLWRNSIILGACCPKHLHSVFNVLDTNQSIRCIHISKVLLLVQNDIKHMKAQKKSRHSTF